MKRVFLPKTLCDQTLDPDRCWARCWTMSRIGNALLLVATLFAGFPAMAEINREFDPVIFDPAEPGVLRLNGTISIRTPVLLKQALVKFPDINTILLDSPGGSVHSALSMAYDIQGQGLRTEIPAGAQCHSACAYLYFAGSERLALGDLGVHQLASRSNDLTAGQIALADITAAFDLFGVPNEVLTIMLKTPANTMHVFDKDEMERLGLTGPRRGAAPNTCDTLLGAAQAGDSCADWTSYLDSCTGHTMAPFVTSHAKEVCRDITVLDTLAPEKPLIERMAADPDVWQCDTLAGTVLHPDVAAGLTDAQGIDFKSIEPDKAISACRAAVQAFPEHPRLMTNLGRAFHAAKDYSDAVTWYERAADKNDPVGQSNLGAMYATGRGVPKSFSTAVDWYQKAADQEYPVAQNNLGSMYVTGRGVQKSYVTAVAWYRKAAAQNYAGAQYNLGLSYENGRGVSKSLAQAIAWYQRSADQGYERARTALRRLQ